MTEEKYAVFIKPVYEDETLHRQVGTVIHKGCRGNSPHSGVWPLISKQIFDDFEEAKDAMYRDALALDLWSSNYYIVKFPVGGKWDEGEVVFGEVDE